MKKYIHPSLKVEVPKELRLEIYKKALDFYENKRSGYGAHYDSLGLCMLFPCILWNLNHYLDMTPKGNDWAYSDSIIAFPELTQEFINLNSSERDKKRISFLKNIIKELEI